MDDRRCLNCAAVETRNYDLLVRGNRHDGVPLCEECYEAIQGEMASRAD